MDGGKWSRNRKKEWVDENIVCYNQIFFLYVLKDFLLFLTQKFKKTKNIFNWAFGVFFSDIILRDLLLNEHYLNFYHFWSKKIYERFLKSSLIIFILNQYKHFWSYIVQSTVHFNNIPSLLIWTTKSLHLVDYIYVPKYRSYLLSDYSIVFFFMN